MSRITGRAVWTLASWELRDALRNRWLWSFTLGFAGLAIGLSAMGNRLAGYEGLGGSDRTTASILNALLLFVPLIALTVGAGAIAPEREKGVLSYLRAQPLSAGQLFLGKALGATLAVLGVVCLGLGITAAALAWSGLSDPQGFLHLAGLTMLMAVCILGLGFVASTFARRGGTAHAAALGIWLALVFVLDLGFLGATLAWHPSPAVLLWILVINPLQAYKVATLHGLGTDLSLLGPTGQYASLTFGAGLPWLMAGLLLAWTAAAFGLAYWRFVREDAP